MRVGLRIFYNPGWMGGINYVLNVARMLHSLPDIDRPEIVFLTTTPAAKKIAEENSMFANEIHDFNQVRHLNLDFVYPATQLPEAPFGAPWAGWIPDWQCQHYPQMFERREIARRFLQYRELAKRPAVCVFSSAQALEDTKVLFPECDDVGWSIFNFPAVFDDDFWENDTNSTVEKTLKKYNVPSKYFVICNQFWKHKNHLVVAEALALDPSLDIHIVMTGAIEDSRWPKYAKQVQDLLQDTDVARRITLTHQISRGEQLDFLKGAAGFIQPSLFEGWSTFVEEARALGLPGLISDIAVHREQSPPNSIFFDPHDPNSLAKKMSKMISSPSKKVPLKTARNEQTKYILSCAENFMAIVRKAQNLYNPEKNEMVAVLDGAIPEVRDYVYEDELLNSGDFDSWLAATRMSLRDHPEDLARLGSRLCQDDKSFSKEAKDLVVFATLAKCSSEIRQRFLDFDPMSDNDVLDVRRLQNEINKRDVKTKLALRNTLFRLQDFVRRKLPNLPN